jgi:hypothetical protein
MLRIIHFGKPCICHLQGEFVVVGRFWKLYMGQTVGGELDLMALIRGAEERAAIQWEKNVWLKKLARFAEKLDNFQYSVRPVPESRSYTLNSSREKVRKTTKIYCKSF